MATVQRNLAYTHHLKLLKEKHHKLKGHDQAEFNDWLNKIKVRRAIQLLRGVEVVPTIYQKETPEKISSFYYPCKVYNKKQTEKTLINIDLYSDFNSQKGIIIEGTVGQGKSILLRHLFVKELNTGQTIPIFIELKDIKEGVSIRDHIRSYIEVTLKLRCSEKLFDTLIELGLFSFFLDGFDEVKYKQREIFVELICGLNELNPQHSKIIVTSRPGNEIQRGAGFDIFSIYPLIDDEQINFVNKLLIKKHDSVRRNYLKTNIESMSIELRKLLSTPLILTLFAMVYRNKVKIPDSYSEFYRKLFDTLISEHDGLKLGFGRPTKSGLTAEQIKNVLEYSSLISLKNSINEYNEHDFLMLIKSVLKRIGLSHTPAPSVIEDLTKNTCLIQQDDLEYKFLHESIPYYFSASCIANNASDIEAKKFYQAATLKWKKWCDVIEFLANIDKRRFNLDFYLGELESFFIKKELPENFIFSDLGSITFSQNFIIGCSFSNIKKEDVNIKTPLKYSIIFDPNTSWVCHKHFIVNGNDSNKTNLTNFISLIEKSPAGIKKGEIFKFFIAENEMVQIGENAVLAFRLPSFLKKFKLNDLFRTELNRLSIEHLKSSYSDVLASNARVKTNMEEGIFSI